MIRWNTPDSPYGLFSGLSEAEATRRAAVADRERQERDLRALWQMRGFLAALVAIVFLLLLGLVDSPADHLGPDEARHQVAGRLEVR